jgi:hypothetical protein
MVLIILGVVCLVLALVLAGVGFLQLGKLKAMEETETYSVKHLRELHAQAGEALAQPCEVKGTVECDQPFKASLSELMCALYVHKIVRKHEEYYVETDEEGRREGDWREVHQTMPSEEHRQSFWVRDSTGRVLVEPQGAELDLKETLERFEHGTGVQIGSSRTLGIMRTEYVLEDGAQCYVLGHATDQQGQLVIGQAPPGKRQNFLISHRTEEQLSWATSMWALVSLVAAVLLGLSGIVLIALQLR